MAWRNMTHSGGTRDETRALSDKIEPFDRDDFASWLGALRMAMSGFPDSGNRQRCATTPRRKRTRPPVGGANRLPGFVATLARFSDSENQASRFTPRLPGKPLEHRFLAPRRFRGRVTSPSSVRQWVRFRTNCWSAISGNFDHND